MQLFPDEDPRVQAALDELQRTPMWPFDPSKDRQFVIDLVAEFPRLDLAEEVRSWRTWMLDHDERKKVRPRARLRTWCKKAIEFGAGGGDVVRRRGDAGSRSGASAARPEEHGPTSDGLEQW